MTTPRYRVIRTGIECPAIALDRHGRVYLTEGFINTLNARLDTLERKLDWIHAYQLRVTSGLRGFAPEWPGDLPSPTVPVATESRNAEGTKE